MKTVRCGHMSHVTFRKIATQSVVNDLVVFGRVLYITNCIATNAVDYYGLRIVEIAVT